MPLKLSARKRFANWWVRVASAATLLATLLTAWNLFSSEPPVPLLAKHISLGPLVGLRADGALIILLLVAAIVGLVAVLRSPRLDEPPARQRPPEVEHRGIVWVGDRRRGGPTPLCPDHRVELRERGHSGELYRPGQQVVGAYRPPGMIWCVGGGGHLVDAPGGGQFNRLEEEARLLLAAGHGRDGSVDLE